MRPSDEPCHCNTEDCYWFRNAQPHVGPCYDNRASSRIKADDVRSRLADKIDPVGHPEDWGHKR